VHESLLNLASFISVFPRLLLEIIFFFLSHLTHNHLFTFSLQPLVLIFHRNVFYSSTLGYYGLFSFDSSIFTLQVKMGLAALIIIHFEPFTNSFDLPYLMVDNCINLLIVVIFLILYHLLSLAFVYLPLFYEGDLSME